MHEARSDEDMFRRDDAEAKSDEDVSDAQRAELRRRMKQYRAGKSVGSSWQAVKENLRQRSR